MSVEKITFVSDTIFPIVCAVSQERWVQSLMELLTIPRLIDSRLLGTLLKHKSTIPL